MTTTTTADLDALAAATCPAAARAEHARAACSAVAEGIGWPADAACVVAALALVGQGGHEDTGGPNGASALPLLPAEPIWRWRRQVGGAWVCALRTVAAPVRVVADHAGVWPRISLAAGEVTVFATSAAVLAVVRRALRGDGVGVDGVPHTVTADGDREIVAAAVLAAEAAS